MSNLDLTQDFSKTFFPNNAQTKIKSSNDSGKVLSEYRKYFTVANVNDFLTTTTHIGKTKLNRSELLYLLLLNNSYSHEHPIFSKKQEKNRPNNIQLRKMYRCEKSLYASKADKVRIFLVGEGLIRSDKISESKEFTVSFSRKFFFYFCLSYLKKERQALIEKTRLKMITEEDFLARVEIENDILFLKKKIKQNKEGESLRLQIKKRKSTTQQARV